ncbi:MAG: hypothetical protein ACXVSX_20560, partial [Solirubrobacteraceae bacterium]
VNPRSSLAARVTGAPRGAGARPATLRLLRAPGLRAHRGVSRAGRAIGADGRLHGRDGAVPVVEVGGRWEFTLPPASAGLLSEASGIRDRHQRKHKARS